MSELFTAGLALIVAVATYLIFEVLDLVSGRRNRDRLRAVIAVVVLGTALVSPKALTAGIDWYAHRKAREIQHQIEELPPPPTTTLP